MRRLRRLPQYIDKNSLIFRGGVSDAAAGPAGRKKPERKKPKPAALALWLMLFAGKQTLLY